MAQSPRITVVGSANVDLVAWCERLPRPGETVTDARLERFAGGKGANQAVAAARLGARVRFVGRVGRDDLVLRSLEREGVDVTGVVRDEGESGTAVILVEASGENMIVVAPGANHRLGPEDVRVGEADAVVCQMEIPSEAIAAAAAGARFFCLNAAPARRSARTVPGSVGRQPLRVRGGRAGSRARGADLGGRGGRLAGGRYGGRARTCAAREGGGWNRGRAMRSVPR